MIVGKVARLMKDRGYGFLRAGTQDYFFHRSCVREEAGFTFDGLREGDQVEFEEQDSPKGPRAENITRG
jgi:cold shock CspA family protein